jgi:hypothetical protein
MMSGLNLKVKNIKHLLDSFHRAFTPVLLADILATKAVESKAVLGCIW